MAQNYFPLSSPPPYSAPSSPQHSPPSLIYSDFSEDLEDTMNPSEKWEDASGVLQKVLGQLDQVVEHLRDKDENEAANSIAKDTLNIIDVFNNATAPWDIDTFLMSPRAIHRPNPTLSSAGPLTGHGPQQIGGGTWAAVAGKPVKGKNPLIKYHPHDGVTRRVVEEVPKEPEEPEEDSRVVWIRGWDAARALSTVTERVSSGPLLSMVFSPEHNAVCLIFQNATSARDLLLQDTQHQERHGYCLFGRECNVLPGLAYPEDNDIRRMAQPFNERRRLTFARSQLFAHGMTEEQFKNDVFQIVGDFNVELVWLFNTGNATVVFTSTAIARTVRDNFRQKSRLAGPYQNVHVSFSHDPCEKAMNLITQIPGGDGRVRSGSFQAQPGGPGLGRGLSRRDPKRKNLVDADGWQKVVGKKH